MKVRLTFNQGVYTLGGTIESCTKEVDVIGYNSFADFLRLGVDDRYVNTGTGLYAAHTIQSIELVDENGDVDDTKSAFDTNQIKFFKDHVLIDGIEYKVADQRFEKDANGFEGGMKKRYVAETLVLNRIMTFYEKLEDTNDQA